MPGLLAMTRPTHIEHPAKPGTTLCSYHMGEGCRVQRNGETVTCEGCRAVVHFCRETVRLGVASQAPQEN